MHVVVLGRNTHPELAENALDGSVSIRGRKNGYEPIGHLGRKKNASLMARRGLRQVWSIKAQVIEPVASREDNLVEFLSSNSPFCRTTT